MKKKIEKLTFKNFLTKFPSVPLPITLGNESHLVFSRTNEPLNSFFIENYIALMEGTIDDDYTEIVPCFSIPDTSNFYAIVYWKATLMDYQYILATFNKEGVPIDRKVIGGIYSDGKNIAQSISTIDSDWTVHIVTGHSSLKEEYDAANSTAMELELLPDGHIIEEER